MRFSLRWLLHNVIIHPLCGVFWFLGFDKLPDRLHDWASEEGKDLNRLAEEIQRWALATFSASTPHSCFLHLQEEIEELSYRLEDPGEIADCFMLLLDLAQRAGVDFSRAVAEKFEVCKNRRWGKPDSQGVVRHIKETSIC